MSAESSPRTELHPSIVALVALSANIASNHPNQALCQIDKLKGYGVAREQIDAVIEIARHIRDESSQMNAQKLDARFDAAYAEAMAPAKPAIKPDPFANIAVVEGGSCCTPTKSGQACC